MKLLVIGGGSIGKRHIKNLKTLAAGEIIACDTSLEHCCKIEEEFGVKAYKDFNEALMQKPDAIHSRVAAAPAAIGSSISPLRWQRLKTAATCSLRNRYRTLWMA